MDAGAWSCGMVAGLIHDIPTCKELIDRIMAEAEAIIRKRLTGLLGSEIRDTDLPGQSRPDHRIHGPGHVTLQN
jgi:hypothetical protein